MASTVTKMALRTSNRLSNKAPVIYKEKKIPVKKAKTLKKVVKKETAALQTTAKNIEKIKKEIKQEPVTENFDILRRTRLQEAIEHMKKHDPKLAAHLDDAAITAFQERLNKADGSNPFMSLTRSIVYQQIHGKAAASIYARFLNLFDPPNETWFPTPAQVLAKNDEELRSAGLSGRKADYIRNLALHFENGSITPDKFDQMSDTEISTQLCAVKGIGQWTVDMFLMLDLHHPDVLPLGDLAVRKGVAKHFGLKLPSDKKKIFPDAAEMLRLTEIWRPYRTLGSWLMWRISNIVVTGD